MIDKTKLALIAAIAALGIAMPAAAMAQSAYTSGSAASRVAAGYPSPYGGPLRLRPGLWKITPRFANGEIKAVMTTAEETAYRSRAISPRPEQAQLGTSSYGAAPCSMASSALRLSRSR